MASRRRGSRATATRPPATANRHPDAFTVDTLEEFPGFGGHGGLDPVQVYIQFCPTEKRDN